MIFRDVVWYEWLYKVSETWIVYSIKKWIKLSLYKNQWYDTVYLYKDGKRKFHLVHRLVLSAFIWVSDQECNHKNWFRDDNRLENLEYCTREHNMQHRRDELWFTWPWEMPVCQYTKKWDLLKIWRSMSLAARELSIHHIYDVCNNKREFAWWYAWRYWNYDYLIDNTIIQWDEDWLNARAGKISWTKLWDVMA